jgi:hypothetical protein
MMLQFLDRKEVEQKTPSATLTRHIPWIVLSVAFLVVYAAVFGPTLKPNG